MDRFINRNWKLGTIITIAAILVLVILRLASATMPTVASNTQPVLLGNPIMLNTTQFLWQHVRTVTASDTALTTLTKAWTTIQSKFVRTPAGWNRIRLACYADGDGSGEGDPNGGSFSWKLFVCERWSGAKLVATGTWAIGEEVLSHDPDPAAGVTTALTYGITDPNSSKWGELPVRSTCEWDPQDPNAAVRMSGTANDIGEIDFDARGSYGFYLEVTSLSSVTDLYVLAKGY